MLSRVNSLHAVTLAVALSTLCALHAHAQDAALPDAPDAGAEEPLPVEHQPRVTAVLDAKGPVALGEKIRLAIEASALEGDDVTVPEQSFAPLEVVGKSVRVVPAKDGRQSFVFDLDFISLTPGVQQLKGVELSVVTRQGLVGRVRTEPFKVEVRSRIANEPNAAIKEPSKPVVVMQDDYTIPYVAGGLAAAALLALISVLAYRLWQRRAKPLPPPPPPRPPWEIAVEMLAELRRRKHEMLEAGLAGQFVDQVSDVVRRYLGGRFRFDGLESTSDEMLTFLRRASVPNELYQEVATFLRRCDLVKFAKLEPDAEEADWVLRKAQEIVQLGEPRVTQTPELAPPAPPTSSTPAAPTSGVGE